MEDLVAQLQKRGGQAVDVSQYQEDMNTIISEFQSMTNVQSGLDTNGMMQSWYKIMQVQSSMVFRATQTSLYTGAFTEYTAFISRIMAANSQFFTKATAECSFRQQG